MSDATTAEATTAAQQADTAAAEAVASLRRGSPDAPRLLVEWVNSGSIQNAATLEKTLNECAAIIGEEPQPSSEAPTVTHATAASVAMILGALIERGVPPDDIAPHLLRRVERMIRDGLGEDATKRADALTALNERQMHLSIVACFSMSANVRSRGAPASLLQLLPAAREIAPELHWLERVLQITNDLILVVDPASKLGMVCGASGVSDMAQLQSLLQQVFPRADGEPPRARGTNSWGMWNAHMPLDEDTLTLRTDNLNIMRCMISGEAAISEVPMARNLLVPGIDGRPHDYRVVYLAKPMYTRSIDGRGVFPNMRPTLQTIKTFSKEEVETALRALLACERSDEEKNSETDE